MATSRALDDRARPYLCRSIVVLGIVQSYVGDATEFVRYEANLASWIHVIRIQPSSDGHTTFPPSQQQCCCSASLSAQAGQRK